jgi:SpoIIAA-like
MATAQAPDTEEDAMLDVDVDAAHSIIVLHPESALGKNDFVELAKVVDPQIEANGALAGLIIDAPTFPGWDSFGAMVSHIRFVHDHHKHVKKIAVVTDSHLGDFAEHLAAHFVSAVVRQFPAGHVEQAREWIAGGE